jgi:hypothetical protein
LGGRVIFGTTLSVCSAWYALTAARKSSSRRLAVWSETLP